MEKRKFLCCLLIILTAAFSSCKKDYTPQADVLYTLEVDGNQVTFATQTQGVTAYNWNFGDGETSTEANPVHTYPGKGKYVATLTATLNGQNVETSTIIRIAKSSPVKINDNSLADWDQITTNVITSGTNGGIFRKAKFDYDGNYIYAYFEMASTKANADIFDFYIDSDNDATTGLLTGSFPNGGYDILLEGQLLTAGVDIFYHTGAQTSFSFDQQSIAEAYQVGTIVESGGILKFEMRIARGKLKGLTGTGARFGVVATKNDWSVTLGSIPDDGTSGYLLDMSE